MTIILFSSPPSEILFRAPRQFQKQVLFRALSGYQGDMALFRVACQFGDRQEAIFRASNQFEKSSIGLFRAPCQFEKLGIEILFRASRHFGPQPGPWALSASQAFKIYINGVNETTRITGGTLTESWDSIHKELSISAASPELYRELKEKNTRAREIGIRMILGTRDISFYGEKLSGTEAGWTLWGRDVSCIYSEPYAEKEFYQNPSKKLASEVAAGFIPGVNWQAHDWLLPTEFNSNEYPSRAVKAISEKVGGFLNSTDAAGFEAKRKRYPRPVNLSEADIYYDEVRMISISHQREFGTGESSVEISGYLSETAQEFKIEKISGEYIGDDVIIRIYWGLEDPPTLSALSTDGQIYYMGTGQSDHEKLFTITNGSGVTEYPIQDIYNIEWISDEQNFSWKKYGSDILIDEKYGVFRIKYKSEYQEYRLSGATDKTIIAAFSVADLASGVYIRIRGRDVELKEAEPISDNDLTTKQSAIERGTAYLDGNRYDKDVYTVGAPYYDSVRPGKIAFINDAGIGAKGYCYIRKHTVSVGVPQIISTLELEKCRI